MATEPRTSPAPETPEPPPTLLERAGSAAAGVGGIGSRRPRLKAAIQAGLAILIFGFLVGFVLSQWSKLPEQEWRFHAGWLLASIAAVAAFYVVQCEMWRFILRALGEDIEPVPGRAIWGKSLIARYVPTNVLMLVGRIVMAEREGVAKRVCLASMVYELGLALCAAVITGAYFVITLPRLEDQPARYAILAVIPLALAAMHPRVFLPVANFALRKLGRESLPSAVPFGRVLVFVVAYLVGWAVIGLGVYAFASALHPLSGADLPYVAASYSVGFCVAVLTFIVPSGLGTRDAALATALAAVLPAAVATAIAVAFRLLQTAVELLFVGALVALGRRAKAAAA